MARPLRIEIPGGVYHVTARGNGRRTIFRDDPDRLAFLDLLEKVLSRFDWQCLTYCLMGNHYHIVIRTTRPNLSRGMGQLNSVYAQQFNRRHRTCGHFFQGRFGAVLIEADSYLCEVARYVALNPVRANMCSRPEHWPWSAHLSLIGRTKDKIVDARYLLEHFGPNISRSRQRYQAFVNQVSNTWKFDENAVIVGSPEFVEAHMPSTSPSVDIPRRLWHQNRPPLCELFDDRPLEEAINTAYHEYGYTMREIAGMLGCHRSTVSRKLKELEVRR